MALLKGCNKCQFLLVCTKVVDFRPVISICYENNPVSSLNRTYLIYAMEKILWLVSAMIRIAARHLDYLNFVVNA